MKLKMILGLLILIFGMQLNVLVGQENSNYHAWWDDRHAGNEYESKTKDIMPLIKVEGNKFVDLQGNIMLFKGVSISDPDKIENQGQWNKEYFETINEWGIELIRIPVHPVAWRERTPEKYLELIDQSVEWCTDLGIYIIIDWHSIGNLKSELFQDPMYATTYSETSMFWRTISKRYSGHNTIAFYELFNEPSLFRGQLGSISWSEWKDMMEELIDLVRAFDKQTIPLVAGFDWAYDLTPLRLEPIGREGIGYVTHPYPNKCSQPWEPQWDQAFGFATDKYPVIATEIGFVMGDSGLKANGDYGNRILKYLNNRGISWLWWVFDPQWHPNMIESWDTFKPTEYGQFCKDSYK
ncbi:MAG: cellulase family glycosylhydrolase [Salinivirgaceae bacterium]|nr:cellulase family glycosylhydrolase [Salinivirgaceae bacterium]